MAKILILMIEGGGGHRTAAQAIAGGIEHLYGDKVAVSIVDVSKKYSFRLINQLDEVFRWLTSDGVLVWKALWSTDEKTWIPWVLSRLLTPFFSRTMRQVYLDEAPDLVVSVHGLANHIPLRVLRKVQADVPFVTVVTDMVSVHFAWFCREVDYCMVPTEEARQRALRCGMPRDRVEVVGQPVSLGFAADLGEKRVLRQQLDLDPDRPCVLIVGGGDGMGPVYEIARVVAVGVPSVQLVVVAGRNTALEQELRRATWEIPTRICGFVDNMPMLMAASDLLITKAGSCTLAEAFIAGLPVIISGFIPGQEEGNVQYVLKHQAGAYASDPAEIVQTVREWLRPGDGSPLRQAVANAAALACPDAALTIAQRLYGLLQCEPERCSGVLRSPTSVTIG